MRWWNAAFVAMAVGMALMAAGQAHAAVIYLCRSDAGHTFWSQASCRVQQARTERTVTVPDGLSFDEQVRFVQRQLGDGVPVERSDFVRFPDGTTSLEPAASCEALAARVVHLDALARQPQPVAATEVIREARRAARDQQFRQRC